MEIDAASNVTRTAVVGACPSPLPDIVVKVSVVEGQGERIAAGAIHGSAVISIQVGLDATISLYSPHCVVCGWWARGLPNRAASSWRSAKLCVTADCLAHTHRNLRTCRFRTIFKIDRLQWRSGRNLAPLNTSTRFRCSCRQLRQPFPM